MMRYNFWTELQATGSIDIVFLSRLVRGDHKTYLKNLDFPLDFVEVVGSRLLVLPDTVLDYLAWEADENHNFRAGALSDWLVCVYDTINYQHDN